MLIGASLFDLFSIPQQVAFACENKMLRFRSRAGECPGNRSFKRRVLSRSQDVWKSGTEYDAENRDRHFHRRAKAKREIPLERNACRS